MADKRIIELEERLTLEENDYLASDNTNGTCKVNAGIITNQFSDMQNKLGAKNLLKNGLTSRTTSGLTITVNSNGSILINGTAAADVSLTLVQNFTLAAGEYILSGVGSDAPGIGLSLNASYGGNTVTCNKDNTQKHFTLSSDSNITNVNMYITAGLAFTNYTLYPMIRPASVADEAFVAYEKTNAQLTKELGDPSTASAVSGSDAFGKIASLNNDLSNNQTNTEICFSDETVISDNNGISHTAQHDGELYIAARIGTLTTVQVFINDKMYGQVFTASMDPATSINGAPIFTLVSHVHVKVGDVIKVKRHYGSYAWIAQQSGAVIYY